MVRRNQRKQLTIVKPEKSPIPFMFIKTGMLNVFETLCPRKVEVSKYDVTPIPLEILDLVALSKRENYFKKIEIWYDDKNPDPLGTIYRGGHPYPTAGADFGYDYTFPNSNIFLGVGGNYLYRSDFEFWEENVSDYWKLSGFVKIGIRF